MTQLLCPPFAPTGRFYEEKRYLTATNTRTTIANFFPTTWGTVYMRPTWATNIEITGWGAGGGGGGGLGGAAGSGRGGGAGGGSGSGCRIIIPAWQFPRLVYVVVGIGGPPGASGATGSTGGYTFIASPGYDANNGVLLSFTPGQGGSQGINGSSTGGTTGALGSPQFLTQLSGGGSTTAMLWLGQQGSAGNIAGGTAGGPLNQSPMWGGSGGGGVTTLNVASNGGGVLTNAPFPPFNSALGGVANGGDGDPQVLDWLYTQNSLTPFHFQSSGGGAGSSAGTGGKGGLVSYGAGGSGGGGGLTTGGAGSKGGDGGFIFRAY